MAVDCGMTVVNASYALAPENKNPMGANCAYAAL